MRPIRILPCALAALFFAAAAPTAHAQSADAIYSGGDLDQPPKLANPTKTARIVAQSYPANLKRMGVAGQAQVQFVVDANGKVEPESVEVVLASTPAFGDAAKEVVPQIEFHPGKAKGQAVRSRVLLPIMYK